MRTFEHFNSINGAVCPVCKTSKDTETVLVPIQGTEDGNLVKAKQGTEDGNLVKAKQVHKKCYDLVLEMNDMGD